jgi:hypothetical protein
MNTIGALESKTKIACTNLLIELFHTYFEYLCLFWVTKNLIRNVLNKNYFLYIIFNYYIRLMSNFIIQRYRIVFKNYICTFGQNIHSNVCE